jgi:hypothetical protein
VVSPVLANLFLHYAFDMWLAREFPAVTFERYVDDAVVHCESETQAKVVVAAIAERMEQVGLRLHLEKTKIVYCKDGKRRGSYEHTSFTFLGFTFRQRKVRDKNGRLFSSINPAISKDALKRLNEEVRAWRVHLRTGQTLAELARTINPIVRGWMQYYGAFYRSVLHPLLSRINAYLMRWIRKKYQRLGARKKAMACWQGITERYPACSHTGNGLLRSRASGDQDDKSPVNREVHAGTGADPGPARGSRDRRGACRADHRRGRGPGPLNQRAADAGDVRLTITAAISSEAS